MILRKEEAISHEINEDWGSLRWLASAYLGNSDTLTVGYVMIKIGKSNPRHLHPDSEEVLYLLKGKMKHITNNDTYIINEGDTITIPPNSSHNAINIGDCNAEMIVSYPTANRKFIKVIE